MAITRATNLAGLGTVFDALTDGGGLSISGISTFTDLNVTRANITGVSTFATLNITNSNLTQLDVTGVTTTITLVSTAASITTGGLVAGIATVNNINTTQLNVTGLSTAAQLNVGTGGTVITTTDNGNIGLGTNNPTDRLHIWSSATTGEIRIGGSNGPDNHRVYISSHPTLSYLDSYGNNSYAPFYIEANPLILCNTGGSGNVGIGTDNPNDTLEVLGSAIIGKSGAASQIRFRRPSEASITGFVGYTDSGNDAKFEFRGDGGSANVKLNANNATGYITFDINSIEKVRIDSNGNVGIGNTNPQYALVVGSGTDDILNIDTLSAGSGVTLRATDDGRTDYEPLGFAADFINFYTRTGTFSSAERVRITSGGDVGIGYDSPNCRLLVRDTATHTAYGQATPSVSDCTLAVQNTPTSEAINNHATIQFNVNGGTYNRVCSISAVAQSASNRYAALTFCTDDASGRTEKMRITSDGQIMLDGTTGGVGHRKGSAGQFIVIASNGGFFHQTPGPVYYAVTTSGGNTSDERLKTGISTITNALDKISAINGVYFTFIEEPMSDPDKGIQLGVIAQEVETVLPEAVVTDNEGIKNVRYEKLIPPLIESVKELSSLVNTQQQTINNLLSRIESLESTNP